MRKSRVSSLLKEREKEKKRERKRERECVFVCVLQMRKSRVSPLLTKGERERERERERACVCDDERVMTTFEITHRSAVFFKVRKKPSKIPPTFSKIFFSKIIKYFTR